MHKAAAFIASLGIGFLMTAAGLVLEAAWLAVAGLVLLGVSGLVFLIGWKKRKKMQRDLPPEQSGTSFVSGDVGELDLEDNFSSADTFMDGKAQRFTGRRNVHKPKRGGTSE
ncbi:phage holin family protein [Erythrobacter sp. G21629-S1]|nr:phage holin family protein [Erythrobacter sp. G21629-S1]